MASGKRRTPRGKSATPPAPSTTRVQPVSETLSERSPATSGQPGVSRAVAAPALARAAAGDAPVRRSDNVDWSNEYSYVVGDLKQMAVISVVLFAVMILIGYFL